MQSRNAYILGSFVIPEGATTGIRIEFDAENGVILVYDASNRLIGSIAPAPGIAPDGSNYVGGIASYGVPPTNVIVSLDSAGALRFEDGPQDTPFTANGLIAATNPGVANPGNTAKLTLFAPATAVGAADQAFMSLDSESADGTSKARQVHAFSSPNTDGHHQFQGFVYGAKWVGATLTREEWVGLPFAANWANLGPSCFYRLFPDGTVRLRGIAQKTTVGTPADGTVIATLPAGYRPVASTLVPIACDSSNVKARLEIDDTTGNIAVFDMPNRFPCLDGVNFAVAGLA